MLCYKSILGCENISARDTSGALGNFSAPSAMFPPRQSKTTLRIRKVLGISCNKGKLLPLLNDTLGGSPRRFIVFYAAETRDNAPEATLIAPVAKEKSL